MSCRVFEIYIQQTTKRIWNRKQNHRWWLSKIKKRTFAKLRRKPNSCTALSRNPLASCNLQRRLCALMSATSTSFPGRRTTQSKTKIQFARSGRICFVGVYIILWDRQDGNAQAEKCGNKNVPLHNRNHRVFRVEPAILAKKLSSCLFLPGHLMTSANKTLCSGTSLKH